MSQDWYENARFSNRKGRFHGPAKFNDIIVINRRKGPTSRHRDNQGDRQVVNANRNKYQAPRRGGRRHDAAATHEEDSSSWYKVVIPSAYHCNKDHLMEQFTSLGSQVVFYNFHKEHNSMVFFVQGVEQSEVFKAAHRRIRDMKGSPLNVQVYLSQMPFPPINRTLEENVTEAMKRRYNINANYLDLTNFAHEPGLLEVNLYVPLSRLPIFALVVKKIRENYPDIHCLSLSNNKLLTLEPLKNLATVCKYIRAIDLSHNKLKKSEELDCLKNFELQELIIEGNYFANLFTESERNTLVSSIRSKFPKLTKLDRIELPPAIGFDVGGGQIPPVYGHHIPAEIRNFVGEFLQQYFKIYDSPDRTPMLAAYHDNAVFSYSLAGKPDKQLAFLASLISGSRNLFRIREDSDQRVSLLHQGGRAVVEALKKFPLTKHFTSSMTIDVPFFTADFYTIVVNGVFKEFTKKQQHCRAYARTFIIIPQGQGFVIINDILVITNATVDQIHKYNRSLEEKSIMECLTTDKLTLSSLAGLSLGEMDSQFASNPTPNKEQLVQQFCEMTRMNRQFSAQCLEENGYDLQKAFAVFSQLNENGVIPAEAFIIT